MTFPSVWRPRTAGRVDGGAGVGTPVRLRHHGEGGAGRNAEDCIAEARDDMASGAFDRAITNLQRVEGLAAGTLLASRRCSTWPTPTGAPASARRRWPPSTASSGSTRQPRARLRAVPARPDQLQRQPRPPEQLARQDLSERDQRASRDALPGFKQLVDQFPTRAMPRRAGAHGLHHQLAGRLRGARGALLLPPRRLRGGGQPRAAGGRRVPAFAGRRRGAVHHGAELRQAATARAARRRRARAARQNFPESPYLARRSAAAALWWQFW
jgi:outer membrane protein assembly factor BamD